MAALGVAPSRGSGSHSRCKLPRRPEQAATSGWFLASVSQTHLVAVVFLGRATGTLSGCCLAFRTVRGGAVPGAVVAPCLHGACFAAPPARAGVGRQRHCFAPAKTSKMGGPDAGPPAPQPRSDCGGLSSPMCSAGFFCFFSCRAKTGALEVYSDSKPWWVSFQNICQRKPPAPSLHHRAGQAPSAVGAHAQLGTGPPGRAERERRANPALAGSRGR